MANSPEYMRVYMRERHARQRAKALAYLGGVCSTCGGEDRLHFHHEDPATKSFTISSGLKFGWPRLVAELDKCVILCEPCHIRLHSPSPVPHGTVLSFWRGCRCWPCRAARNKHHAAWRARRKAALAEGTG